MSSLAQPLGVIEFRFNLTSSELRAATSAAYDAISRERDRKRHRDVARAIERTQVWDSSRGGFSAEETAKRSQHLDTVKWRGRRRPDRGICPSDYREIDIPKMTAAVVAKHFRLMGRKPVTRYGPDGAQRRVWIPA